MYIYEDIQYTHIYVFILFIASVTEETIVYFRQTKTIMENTKMEENREETSVNLRISCELNINLFKLGAVLIAFVFPLIIFSVQIFIWVISVFLCREF